MFLYRKVISSSKRKHTIFLNGGNDFQCVYVYINLYLAISSCLFIQMVKWSFQRLERWPPTMGDQVVKLNHLMHVIIKKYQKQTSTIHAYLDVLQVNIHLYLYTQSFMDLYASALDLFKKNHSLAAMNVWSVRGSSVTKELGWIRGKCRFTGITAKNRSRRSLKKDQKKKTYPPGDSKWPFDFPKGGHLTLERVT